jgi:hypothetical protein
LALIPNESLVTEVDSLASGVVKDLFADGAGCAARSPLDMWRSKASSKTLASFLRTARFMVDHHWGGGLLLVPIGMQKVITRRSRTRMKHLS